MQRKPVYDALDNLINHEWKTRTSVAAKNGKATFRGFRGTYRLSWEGRDGERSATIVLH